MYVHIIACALLVNFYFLIPCLSRLFSHPAFVVVEILGYRISGLGLLDSLGRLRSEYLVQRQDSMRLGGKAGKVGDNFSSGLEGLLCGSFHGSNRVCERLVAHWDFRVNAMTVAWRSFASLERSSTRRIR